MIALYRHVGADGAIEGLWWYQAVPVSSVCMRVERRISGLLVAGIGCSDSGVV